MFGPNVKADERGFYYHHRENEFHKIMLDLEIVFKEKFGYYDYNILFITGSGTFVNEIVVNSYISKFEFLDTDGTFGKRLASIPTLRDKKLNLNSASYAYPLYETSTSSFNSREHKETDIVFMDAVSAFPYYKPKCDIFTTVSSKQLGAFPVLGIIAFKLGEMYFDQIEGTCLNLREHLEYHRFKWETRNTPAIPLYYDLLKTLETFDLEKFRQKIDYRRELLTSKIPPEEIIGTGPVLTIRFHDSLFLEISKKYNLYESKTGHQIFLWSGTDEEYERLAKDLERIK